MKETRKLTTNLVIAFLLFGSILGFFFNGASPQFYPAGSVPPINACDLLSNVARLCVPKVTVVLMPMCWPPPSCLISWPAGTLVLQFDVFITFITFSSVLLAVFVLGRRVGEF